MNTYHYRYTSHPVCKTCGRKMDYWIIGTEVFEHNDCSINRMKAEISGIIKKQFELVKPIK